VAEKGIAVPRDLGIQILSATELRTFRDLPPIDFITGDPNRLAYILFTSGTSGIPRPVAHAHRAIWARQMMWKDWYDLNENDRLLHAGAFNWSFTLGTGLLDPWSVGATSIILGHDATFASLPKIMKQNQATLFAAAPGVYRQMLSNTQELDLPDLRHGLCAGEKLSAGIHESWTASTGLGLHEAFGMTECSTFISASPGKAASESLGMPQRGRRVAIVSEKGPVAQGEIGQIAISKSDAGLMLGYLDAPEETLRRYQGEWFLTGDLGSIAADGGISYHGRQDDMMNAGGFRVSPIEVEKTLQLHPKINEVAVTDIEIKTDTQVIAAFYTSDEDIASEDLQSYVENKLARYKQPRIYQRLDSLPRGVNNKLLRKKLKLETDQ
jgi:acyl-coenzyme A synthetase/AMP-(fatty) acid ligase